MLNVWSSLAAYVDTYTNIAIREICVLDTNQEPLHISQLYAYITMHNNWSTKQYITTKIKFYPDLLIWTEASDLGTSLLINNNMVHPHRVHVIILFPPRQLLPSDYDAVFGVVNWSPNADLVFFFWVSRLNLDKWRSWKTGKFY